MKLIKIMAIAIMATTLTCKAQDVIQKCIAMATALAQDALQEWADTVPPAARSAMTQWLHYTLKTQKMLKSLVSQRIAATTIHKTFTQKGLTPSLSMHERLQSINQQMQQQIPLATQTLNEAALITLQIFQEPSPAFEVINNLSIQTGDRANMLLAASSLQAADDILKGLKESEAAKKYYAALYPLLVHEHAKIIAFGPDSGHCLPAPIK